MYFFNLINIIDITVCNTYYIWGVKHTDKILRDKQIDTL